MRHRSRRVLWWWAAAGLVIVALGLATAAFDRGAPDEVASARSSAPLNVGISANLRAYRGAPLAARARAVRSTGLGWVREDFDWSLAEPVRGQHRWRRLDRTVSVAAGQGLRVLPVITYTPAWAGTDSSGPPNDPADFARFTAAVVGRYGPHGTFWRARPALDRRLAPSLFEIWNEPYNASFWRPRADAVAYARLFALAARAGRKADPEAGFMLAGETVADGTPWLDALYEVEPALPSLTAAVSAHPYAVGGAGPLEWTPESPTSDQQVRRVEQMNAIMRRRGDGRDPIWITEIGWHTAPLSNGVSERRQALYLEQVFELAATRWRGFVRAVFWYEWDGPEADPSDEQQWFGLMRRQTKAKAKPAFRALLKVTRCGARNEPRRRRRPGSASPAPGGAVSCGRPPRKGARSRGPSPRR